MRSIAALIELAEAGLLDKRKSEPEPIPRERQSKQVMRRAKIKGASWQRYRAQEMARISRL